MERPHPADGPSPFEELFTRSRVGILIVDDQRRYVAVNSAAWGLLGLSSAEIIGRTIDDFTPLDAKAGLDSRWQAFIEAGVQAGEYELILPDGERRRFEYSATANIEPGRHVSLILAVRGASAARNGYSSFGEGRRLGQSLTAREREVMTHLAAGEIGKEIAAALGISPETVRNHVRNAREKLGARTRAHAIALALQRGEVP